MPAPTNTSALTAIDLGTTVPVTVTQEVDDGVTSYTVWYKYTAQTGNNLISIFGFGDLAVYKPTTFVYLGPASAPVLYLSSALSGAQNVPLQFPVTPGTTYYFQIQTNGSTKIPSNLTLRLDKLVDQQFSAGDILINDDTPDLPAIILSSSTGLPIKCLQGFPAGEEGDALTNGVVALGDDFNSQIMLYDHNLSLITTITSISLKARCIKACRPLSKFFLGINASPAQIKSLSQSGTVTSVATFGGAGLICMAPSNDGTKLYYSDNSGPVKVWDLVNDVGLSDLVATVTGYLPQDMLVLTDGKIAVLYHKDSTHSQVIVYNSDGTTAQTIAITDTTSGTTNLLSPSLDDPVSFRVWLHLADGTSKFNTYKVSDGSTVTSLNTPEFETGVYQPASSATPSSYFGHSFSCPFVTLQLSQANSDSGLYQVVRDKRNDTLWDSGNVKIPDPFVKTGLFSQ